MTLQRLPALHFPDDWLIDYASGALAEPLAIVVATHVALCEICRAAVADYEAVGGALLETIAPEALAPDALERVFDRLDADLAVAAPAERLPGPLPDYLDADLAALDWRPLCAGVDAVVLRPGGLSGPRPVAAPWPLGTEVALVRLAPGAAAPRHTHGGIEATVILQGGFVDEAGQYEAGDAWIVDASVTHRPVALPDEACLCLAYYDAPLRPVVPSI